MTESAAAELQRTVQRLLGRCLIRLQQYEHLMKAILAACQIAADAESIRSALDRRVAAYSGKTLGTLANDLFEEVVVSESDDIEQDSEIDEPTDRMSFAFRARMMLSPERVQESRDTLKELVAMRNALVHHFIQEFDIFTADGCMAAIRHLENCYARIDTCFVSLQGWATTMETARAELLSAFQSKAFQDLLVDGIGPDGRVDWPDSGIVRALREAVQVQGQGAWSRLDRARQWIEANQPEQAPGRYGCRSWPQVLHESRLFDLEYRQDDDGRRVAWFRLRAG